jgi:hypothetical protein
MTTATTIATPIITPMRLLRTKFPKETAILSLEGSAVKCPWACRILDCELTRTGQFTRRGRV